MRTQLILALAAAPLWAQTLSQGERDFAMSSLHASRKVFLDAISGLSQAQWKFKPAPDRWSIAEIAEHVVLADDLKPVQEMLKSPVAAPGTVDRKQDAKWLEKMVDRTDKRKAEPAMQPTGRWATPAAVAAEFRQRRDHMIQYVETTRDRAAGPRDRHGRERLRRLSVHRDARGPHPAPRRADQRGEGRPEVSEVKAGQVDGAPSAPLK